MLLPKQRSSVHENCLVCFYFQVKQSLDLSSGATYVTLEYAISSLMSVPMATKARADAPICYVALGGAERASAPKMDWQMQHLYYTCEGLWERQPPPHTCTSHTAVPNQHMCTHAYTPLGSSNGHFEEGEPMERKDRAGEQLFCTAWCLLQYVIFSWKSVRLFQFRKMGDQPFTFSPTGESSTGSKRGSALEQT